MHGVSRLQGSDDMRYKHLTMTLHTTYVNFNHGNVWFNNNCLAPFKVYSIRNKRIMLTSKWNHEHGKASFSRVKKYIEY